MKQKTRDLLWAMTLLLLGYFFGDLVSDVNSEYGRGKVVSEYEIGNVDKKGEVGETEHFKKEEAQLSQKNINLTKGEAKYVIDGDTIILRNGEKVRYIGVDSPERGQCWYQQAKDYNRRLVSGKTVRLEIDRSNRDRYQRLLRYVYVDDGEDERFVNLELVRAGLARAKEYPPDVKYTEKLKEAEKYAKENRLGIWGGCRE